MLHRLAASALLLAPAAAIDHYVAAGRQFSFIVEKGNAVAVGRNQYGQLGIGNTDDQTHDRPVFIEDPLNPDENNTIKAIAAGAFHSVFLLDNGGVYTAGRNNHYQLGLDVEKDSKITWPTKISTTSFEGVYTKVAAGYAHTLVLTEEGQVWASGWNAHGQLGLGDETQGNVFGLVPFKDEVKIVDIAAGYDFSYFLTNESVLYATGQNLGGQLGLGHKKTQFYPTISKANVISMAAGESHGLLVVEHQDTERWLHSTGANDRGQLGNGASGKPQSEWAHPDGDLETVAGIAAGGSSSCFSRTDTGPNARVYVQCMGDDSFGQIGVQGGLWDPSRDVSISTPTLVPYDYKGVEGIDVVDGIALGDDHGIFVNHEEVLVTGSNKYGQLGSQDFWNHSFGDGITNLQLVLEFGNRGERPTLAPSPPATPEPSPGPAPSPGTTRNSNSDNDGEGGNSHWEAAILGAAVGLAVVLLLVGLGRNTDDEASEVGPPASTEMAAEQA